MFFSRLPDFNNNASGKREPTKTNSKKHKNESKHDVYNGSNSNIEKEDEWTKEVMKVTLNDKQAIKDELEKLKPIPKMTKMEGNIAKNVEEQKGNENSKEVASSKTGNIKKKTQASRSVIVDELEKKRPTESWLIKVTDGKKKTMEKNAKRLTGSAKKKFALTKPSTPTYSSLKPTTIKETFPTTVSHNLTRTPSNGPTAEAASTPLPQNEASSTSPPLNESEVSGSGSTATTERPTNTAIKKHDSLVEGHSKPTKTTGSGMDLSKDYKATNDDDSEDENSSGDEEEAENERNDNEKAEARNVKDEEKRILCVGDSITEGYYSGGKAFHPYTKKLSELLNAEKNHVVYNVYNEGKSGECVEPEMTNRMPSLIQKYKPVDLAIVIGGTNDFSNHNCTKGNLLHGIKKLHDMAHEAGIKTVAVTIPDSNAPQLPGRSDKEDVWESVNDKIRDYAKEHDDVILCDLAEELPYRTLTDDERKKYWDDNLHYNPAGYDRMAEVIYDVIQGNF